MDLNGYAALPFEPGRLNHGSGQFVRPSVAAEEALFRRRSNPAAIIGTMTRYGRSDGSHQSERADRSRAGPERFLKCAPSCPGRVLVGHA